MDPAAWRARWNAPLRGHRVVVGVLPLRYAADDAELAAMRAELVSDGAVDVLFLASVPAGEAPPPPPGVRCVHVPIPRPTSACDAIGLERQQLDHPTPLLRDAVAEFDPDGDAVWLGHAFLGHQRVLGRPVVGHRPPAWAALEDKTLADATFDAAGVPRAPSLVVPAHLEALTAAAARLDRGAGTVWSGAAAGAVNGGAEFVRWVRSADQARSATRLLAGCGRVRVAPFLEGLPCSVHGLVLPDGVVATRPVELVMLRRAGAGEFLHAGLSTWWDPAEADREQMRAAVRRVGARLAERVGYRGAFGIDGVLTADGFLPTELNTRSTVALGTVAGVGEVPLAALQRALLDGMDPGVAVGDLERLLVEPADAHRTGWVRGFVVGGSTAAPAEVGLAGGPGGVRVAAGREQPLGVLRRGPATLGGLVSWQPPDGLLGAGDVLSAWAPAVLAVADAELGGRFGRLEPPVRVR